MKKLRILFAIPCLALPLALVGCGGSESDFQPAETPVEESAENMSSAYEGNPTSDPREASGAAPAAAPEADKEGGEG